MKLPAALTLLLALSAAPAARAQEPTTTQRVEALYAEGVALYRSSKYRQAIEKFEEAYRLYPEPNLLYNAGKAHEALGELDAAETKYEACASSAGVAADVRDKAQARLAVLQKARLASHLAPSEERAPAAAAAPPPLVAAAPPPESGSGLTAAKWTFTAAAVGLAAGGTLTFLIGASKHADVDEAKTAAATSGRATLTQVEAQALVDDGETMKTVGVALFGGAAAAAVTAVLLFVADGEDSPAVAVLPLGPALAVGGTF